MLKPGKVGIARRWNTIFPTHIFQEFLLIPRMIVEGRIRKNKVRFQGRVQIVRKGICLIRTKVSIDATNRHIHLRHLPCVGVCLLAVNGNGSTLTGVSLNKFCTLYEHTTAATAAIVYTAVVKWAKDRDERLNHAGRSIEFASADTFFFCKLCDAVFIGTAKKVFTLRGVAHVDVISKDVNDITQHTLVQIWACIIFRKDILQSLVLSFNGSHSRIDNRSNFRSMSC